MVNPRSPEGQSYAELLSITDNILFIQTVIRILETSPDLDFDLLLQTLCVCRPFNTDALELALKQFPNGKITSPETFLAVQTNHEMMQAFRKVEIRDKRAIFYDFVHPDLFRDEDLAIEFYAHPDITDHFRSFMYFSDAVTVNPAVWKVAFRKDTHILQSNSDLPPKLQTEEVLRFIIQLQKEQPDTHFYRILSLFEPVVVDSFPESLIRELIMLDPQSIGYLNQASPLLADRDLAVTIAERVHVESDSIWSARCKNGFTSEVWNNPRMLDRILSHRHFEEKTNMKPYLAYLVERLDEKNQLLLIPYLAQDEINPESLFLLPFAVVTQAEKTHLNSAFRNLVNDAIYSRRNELGRFIRDGWAQNQTLVLDLLASVMSDDNLRGRLVKFFVKELETRSMSKELLAEIIAGNREWFAYLPSEIRTDVGFLKLIPHQTPPPQE
jgi:hypothetical protein